MSARDEIVRCCRALWERGLIAGADGNLSVRIGPERLLVTPRGCLKGELEPEDLVEVGLDGRRLDGSREATTELDLHLRIYRCRPDCGAVVHAHPPAATGFAVAGEGIPGDVLPEITLLMGEVPVVPYGTTGTPALGDAAELKALLKPNDWNTLHIIARGNQVVQLVNGRVMSALLDEDEQGRATAGLLGLQIHMGPPMRVEFRNLRIKPL